MQVKICVVRPADTVVDPWTVVVVSVDTAIANAAVAALRQSDQAAKRAKTFCVKSLHQADEADFSIALNERRLAAVDREKDCYVENPQYHDNGDV